MKKRVLMVVILAVGAICWGSVPRHSHWLIWNRTSSAPEGLYRLTAKPLEVGQWVLVSDGSEHVVWAQQRGYVGPDWPLLKRVAAIEDAEICRHGDEILINGMHVADALEADDLGREMPQWSGCHVLENGEVFLLNDHPRSLDGRYFGPTRTDSLEGVAVPLFISSD